MAYGTEYTHVDDVSRTLAVVGFYVSVIALASYTVKERLYMSDALLALLLGIAVGPIGWNLVSPWDWTSYDEETRNRITYELARIVIGIQVLFTGIALPKAYLRHAWKSLTTLLLAVMTIAWLVSAAFIFAFIPNITYLEALCIAACVTPTDPVLANSVVKGRFAEKYIPAHVRNIIAAESGANDGLGFPFIYLAIYLLSRFDRSMSVGTEIGWWILDIWIYQIALSCAMGAVIGFLAMKVVKFAEQHNMIDHESFLAIGIGLTFLTLGLTGMLGSDDILAAFIVGNAFTWDDWFRQRTEDESFQDVIDSLLNAVIFIYIATLLPWSEFGSAELGLDAWRLVVIAIFILLFRRLPWVLALRYFIPDLVTWQEAVFAGWFGPIGVGAVYYAQVGLREIPEDRTRLRALIVPVVYFIVMSSVIVHGITIPIFKHTPKVWRMSRDLTRTKSGAGSTRDFSTKFRGKNDLNVPMQPSDTSADSLPQQAQQHMEQDLEMGMPSKANNTPLQPVGTSAEPTLASRPASVTSGRDSPIPSGANTPRVKFATGPDENTPSEAEVSASDTHDAGLVAIPASKQSHEVGEARGGPTQ